MKLTCTLLVSQHSSHLIVDSSGPPTLECSQVIGLTGSQVQRGLGTPTIMHQLINFTVGGSDAKLVPLLVHVISSHCNTRL